MTELELYIQSTFGVDPEDLTHIASLFKTVHYKKGDYLLKSGQLSDKLGFINSGLLRIYVQTDNKEVTQWISSKGYFVTDLSSFIFSTPARWNIQALSDAELFIIDKPAYNLLGKQIPKWHELEKLFIARCFTILEDRIFSHLSMSAEDRYHYFFENNKELFNQVPLQFIASMLGMTPETFSRIRKNNINS